MTLERLNGLISAIEAESHNPSPSHLNLARLVALFNRELLDYLNAKGPVTVTATNNPAPAVEIQHKPADEPKSIEKKVHKKRK